MNMDVAPNFLIVGAAKSGTTLIWNWLATHPDIYMAGVKEPHFFCFEGGRVPHVGSELDPFYAAKMITDRTSYDALWSGKQKNQICGEASPGYLYYPQTAQRIAKVNPKMFIIALFRNPIERAFSQYMHHVRDGFETCATFERAIKAEEARKKAGFWWGYHYASAGLYAEQWQRFRQSFPDMQLLPLIYDDIAKRPQETYSQICNFLGVAPNDPDLSQHYNVTANLERVPRHGKLQFALRNGSVVSRLAHFLLPCSARGPVKSWVSNHNSVKSPVLDHCSSEFLADFFRSDLIEFSKMIGRDLSHWNDLGS